MIESSSSRLDYNASSFLLEATLFHEFTHLGNAFHNNGNTNGQYKESGIAFEESAYGEPIQFGNYKEKYLEQKSVMIPFLPPNKISPW